MKRAAVIFQNVHKHICQPQLSVQPTFCMRYASTHFGYQTVDEEEKAKEVYNVFARAAKKYDLMNDIMSLGVHRLWKNYFVGKIALNDNMKWLDVAGGTGDIAMRAVRSIQKGGGNGLVTVCDINQPMINVGMKKAAEDPTVDKDRLKWVCGNGEELPFKSGEFNVYTIAFGIRNCTHIDKILEEAFRVLKPGGLFACLEFSSIKPILSPLYDLYSFGVIPYIGKFVSNDYKSYRYLVESIRKFPNQKKFAEMIEAAGFSDVYYQNLSFGICAIHMGTKAS